MNWVSNEFQEKQQGGLMIAMFGDSRFKGLDMNFDEILLPPLSTVIRKSQEWYYEREWRIICMNCAKETFKLKPDAVILGLNIKNEQAKEITRIAMEKHLKVFYEYIEDSLQSYKVSMNEMNKEECEAFIKNGL